MGHEQVVIDGTLDWAMLFGMFCRLQETYRIKGEAGAKGWARAKVLLFLLRTRKPASADVLGQELGIKLEASMETVKRLFADRMVLPVGYSEQMERGKLQEKDEVYELTPKGMQAAYEFVADYVKMLDEERACMAGWELKGGFGVNDKTDNYGLAGALDNVPDFWKKRNAVVKHKRQRR